MLLVGFLPYFSESLLRDEFIVLYAATDVIERTISVFYLLVQFAKFPTEVLPVLPRHVLRPQLLEYFAELLQSLLVPAGIELEGTLHDAAVVEVGNIDDMCLLGVLGPPLLVVLVSQLGEESDDQTHQSSILLNIITYPLKAHTSIADQNIKIIMNMIAFQMSQL